ncbi:kinase-like domain-containing protein [Rhizophagus diaphanus]|nr:kinase-like domain-containing protein [Rhizophagus diaphanus] [Rhizophagus sp. MUCL 43196]
MDPEVTKNRVPSGGLFDIWAGAYVAEQDKLLPCSCALKDTLQHCEIKNFKFNFGNWTSRNWKLDQIIRRSQSNAKGPLNYLKCVPFTEFIDKGERKWPYNVALKTVNDSHQYLQEFLNEHITYCFGITQNPKSKNYIMVLEYAHYDSLRNYLDTNVNTISWDDWLVLLEGIAKGLYYIHEENHVHQDFHSGNILIYQKDGKLYPAIGDLGLCRPLNEANDENQSHDIHLAFKILDGLRPAIPEGTPDN